MENVLCYSESQEIWIAFSFIKHCAPCISMPSIFPIYWNKYGLKMWYIIFVDVIANNYYAYFQKNQKIGLHLTLEICSDNLCSQFISDMLYQAGE